MYIYWYVGMSIVKSELNHSNKELTGYKPCLQETVSKVKEKLDSMMSTLTDQSTSMEEITTDIEVGCNIGIYFTP